MTATLVDSTAPVRSNPRRPFVAPRTVRLIAVGLLGMVLIAIAILPFLGIVPAIPLTGQSGDATAPASSTGGGLATMPSVPIDGVLTVVIPRLARPPISVRAAVDTSCRR